MFMLLKKSHSDKTRLTRDKPGGSTPVFEGQCTSMVLWSVISEEVGDGDSCASKESRVINVLEMMEAPQNSHIGTGTSPTKKVAGSLAQLMCIYTNAHSLGNKQELEAIVQPKNYYRVAITETW